MGRRRLCQRAPYCRWMGIPVAPRMRLDRGGLMANLLLGVGAQGLALTSPSLVRQTRLRQCR